MKIYPIGSISIFVNVDNEQNNILDDILLSKIALTFENYLKQQIELYDFDVDFHMEINWKRGCIIETVTLGIILVGTYAYKFIKDYDKIRNNLLRITEDLKGAFLKIKGRKKLTPKLTPLSKVEIKIIRKLPEKFRKYYEAEKDVKIEFEVTTMHKITIMREDLKEEVSEEEIIKFHQEIDPNK